MSVELPFIDGRFMALDEPNALVSYAETSAELFRFWKAQEHLRAKARITSGNYDEHEARTEHDVVDYVLARHRHFLGAQITLHAWALIEGAIKFTSDFVVDRKKIVGPDGCALRLTRRKDLKNGLGFQPPPDPIELWTKWFDQVLQWPLPLELGIIERVARLREIRNSIGHELLEEGAAQQARIARIAEGLTAERADALFQRQAHELFGDPPGIEWARLAEEVCKSLSSGLKASFPVPASGVHFWMREPLPPR